MGSHRFDEIQAQTEATPQMVTARLKKLEADGLVERRPYNQRPLRYEYHLTQKGKAFYPVVLALRAWGESWCKLPSESLAMHHTHNVCGQPAGLGPLARVAASRCAPRNEGRTKSSICPRARGTQQEVQGHWVNG